ncbi:MAG: hypothetical protein IT435_05695 [Phycisphaerales bacterium]|nr:hypothetical protein [Phycisphaerales bacterium]
MPAWPSTPIDTTDMDAGSDSPAVARTDIKTAVDTINTMIGAAGSASGVAQLDSSTRVPDAQIPPRPICNGIYGRQAAGSYTFTVPADIYVLLVEGWGAGGGGGYTTGAVNQHGGGGGAGGGLIKRLDVLPGDTLEITIGAGGTGTAPGPSDVDGGDGGDTVIVHKRGGSTLATFTAAGGHGGTGAGGGSFGGNGGIGSGGDINFEGGNAESGKTGRGGVGGCNGRSGSAPATPGYGFGGGGYGGGDTGASFAGRDGGILVQY